MKFVFLIFLLCSFFSQSFAAEVRMAFGERLPPFIIPETNSGIEIELVREALAFRGHTLKPEYYPMARIPVLFKNNQIDSIMMDVGEDMQKYHGYYADPPVIYKNVFVTLKKNKISIKKPEDLKKLVVAGFIGAEKRYPEWLSKPSQEGTYSEKNDQSVQVELLLINRADAVLCDKDIFRYYANQFQKRSGYKGPIEIDEFYFTKEDPKNYRPVFRDQKIRDDFNLRLANLMKKKFDKAIYDKYLKN